MTTEQMDWLDDERAGRHCTVWSCEHRATNGRCPCHALTQPGAWWECYPHLGRSHDWDFWNDHAECSRCGANSGMDHAAAMAPCPARAEALSLPESVEVPQEPQDDLSAATGRLRREVEDTILKPILDAAIRVVSWIERKTRR